MQHVTAILTDLCTVGIVATDNRLQHVTLSVQSENALCKTLQQRFPKAEHKNDLLPEFQDQLCAYGSGHPVRFDVDFDLQGVTDFQRRVLDACATIDYGETLTYGRLASLVNRPRAARAVGGAMARNPLPLVIPCHRVVASGNRLGGFSAEHGVSLKLRLLAMEAASSGSASSGSASSGSASSGSAPVSPAHPSTYHTSLDTLFPVTTPLFS